MEKSLIEFMNNRYDILKRDGSDFEYITLTINFLLDNYILRFVLCNGFSLGKDIFDFTCNKLFGDNYQELIEKIIEENKKKNNWSKIKIEDDLESVENSLF